jgi:hypothetical protein
VVILAAGLASLALSAGRVTRSELPAVTAAVITGLVIAGPRAAGRGRRDQGDERGVRGADRDADVRRALRATRLAAAALVAAGIVLISA